MTDPKTKEFDSFFAVREEFSGELLLGDDVLASDARVTVNLNRVKPEEIEAEIVISDSRFNPLTEEILGGDISFRGSGVGQEVRLFGRSVRTMHGRLGSTFRLHIRLDEVIKFRWYQHAPLPRAPLKRGDWARSEKENQQLLKRHRACETVITTSRYYAVHSDMLLYGELCEHGQYGLIHGWKPSDFHTWEVGEWQDRPITIELGTSTIETRISFQFKSVRSDGRMAYVVVPLILVSLHVEENLDNFHLDTLMPRLGATDELLTAFELALSFVQGRSSSSHYQKQFTSNDGSYVRTEIDRFVSAGLFRKRTARPALPPQTVWQLISDLTRNIGKLEAVRLSRIDRAIRRFLSAVDAPYLELKVTILTSAIHMLLRNRPDVRDADIDPALPDWQTNTRSAAHDTSNYRRDLAKFITAKRVQWADLIPEGRPEAELYSFITLRNKYLKELSHHVEDATSLQIAESLFKRCLLADLGLDAGAYGL